MFRARVLAHTLVYVFFVTSTFFCWFFSNYLMYIEESTVHVRLIADTSTRIAHVYTCVYYSTVAPKLQLTFEGTFVLSYLSNLKVGLQRTLKVLSYFRTKVLSYFRK